MKCGKAHDNEVAECDVDEFEAASGLYDGDDDDELGALISC